MANFDLLFKNTKTNFGILASTIDKNALEAPMTPNQLRDEVPTLNQFGYMKLDLSDFCKEFIEYSSKSDDINLELGCAYGFVVQKVLEAGGKIIASDISEKHLIKLLQRCANENLNNLYLASGRFPQEVDFPKNSIGAVLASRIIHFLVGDEIELGLDKIWNWLKPGGKLFFIVTSPYNSSMKDRVLPIYQQKVANGDPWPGMVDTSNLDAHHRPYTPSFINVFDVSQLEELLPKHGFKIDRISLFDYPNDADSEGKGHVGVVATKV